MTEIMSLQTEEESHRGKPSGVEVFAANIKELFEIGIRIPLCLQTRAEPAHVGL